MKHSLLRLLACTAFILALVPPLAAQDDGRLTRLKAADDERVAAVRAADRARLSEILSEDLRYAHSNGVVDTKTSFIESLTSGRSKYASYENEERSFTFPAPGMALMTGRARVQVVSANGAADLNLGFLGVWREEQGRWRFLAWQSCRLPAAAPATPAK